MRGLGKESAHGHQIQELRVAETHSGEYLERRARDSTLVGARIAEEDDALLLERETGGLGHEQVRALDEVFEVGDALRVPKLGHVGDVDRLGATAAGDEDVGLVAEVRAVAEVGPIRDDLSGCTCRQLVAPIREQKGTHKEGRGRGRRRGRGSLRDRAWSRRTRKSSCGPGRGARARYGRDRWGRGSCRCHR